MVNRELVAGVDSYLLWGIESTAFGTAATTINQHFGLVKSFKPSIKNNLTEHGGFKGSTSGGRETASITAGKFEGTLAIEFEPLLWSWLEYVLGTVTGSGTVGDPYVYVAANLPTSLTISDNRDNVTTDSERGYLGCMFTSVTIRGSVGSPVTCSAELACADLDKDSTIQSNVALPDYQPFTFVSGDIEIPENSSVSNIIDSFELTIKTGTEIKYGVGSRIGKRPRPGKFSYLLGFTFKYLDDTWMDDFLGASTGPLNTTPFTPAETASVVLVLSNTANHNIEFKLSPGRFDGLDEDLTLNEMAAEDFTFIGESMTVTEIKTA